MKSIVRLLITVALLLTTSAFSSADTVAGQTVLTSFDFDVVGVSLKASPESAWQREGAKRYIRGARSYMILYIVCKINNVPSV